MLDQKTVREFADELSSNSPAPGGGSVAALASSLSSGLCAMVFNLTVGKKAYNEYSEEDKNLVNEYLKECVNNKDEFLDLMNKDTEVFLTLMAAFKLPKETDEEKATRMAQIQKGYKESLEVPLEVARKSYNMYKYILTAAKIGNKNAISDAGVSALMIQTAIEGAILNVRINLSSIKDEEYKNAVNAECAEMVKNGVAKRDEILAIVNQNI